MDLEYQNGGDELQNVITETTAMRDPGLFISVVYSHCLSTAIQDGGRFSSDTYDYVNQIISATKQDKLHPIHILFVI